MVVISITAHLEIEVRAYYTTVPVSYPVLVVKGTLDILGPPALHTGKFEVQSIDGKVLASGSVSSDLAGAFYQIVASPVPGPAPDLSIPWNVIITFDNVSVCAGGMNYPAEGWTVLPCFSSPDTSPGPVDSGSGAGEGTGLVIEDCVFPTLQWNLIQVLSDLIEWIGCILHNIITILQWVIDWLLHFPDHLDEWISRLFGVDPALPFFDQVMHLIDVKVSTRLGVDPDKPLLEELARKLFSIFTEGAEASFKAGQERLK